MSARSLALASAAVLAALPAAAQDSFSSPQQQQGIPQTQQGQGLPQQQPQAFGQGTTDLDRLTQWERQDLGVAPTDQLHAGPMHGPTPASIPGGQVITTEGLLSLIEGRPVPFVLLDVLGGAETIPGSVYAMPAHQPGRFDDPTQQRLGAYLQQATGGDKDVPLVFYCLSNHCWMSYNAALRAIDLGYTSVLWYRGGLEAWQMAGQATQPAPPTQSGFGQPR